MILLNDANMRRELLDKAFELAFGKSNDAVKLAFLKSGEGDTLDRLDLTQISGVHRLANGTVELKLLDRAKLIELLLGATESAGGPGGEAASLIGALSSAADRLSRSPAADFDGQEAEDGFDLQ